MADEVAEHRFTYDAVVVEHYDGDTIRLDTDLGKGIWERDEPHRLHRINAPEIRGPQKPRGIDSTNWLKSRLPVGTSILIKTVKGPRFVDKKGKFGRWIADIWKDGENINDQMVELGYAEYKDY